MATGFDKFAEKALAEDPIRINKPQSEQTPEQKQIKKFERVVVTRPHAQRPEPEAEKPQSRGVAVNDTVQRPVQAEEPKLFQITIKIRQETKDKLDWLKFSQKKKFMEIAEEAFEDIYKKYGGE